MKSKIIFCLLLTLLYSNVQAVFCQEPPSAEDWNGLLEDVVKKVERRYAGSGFSAEFYQSSKIAAMEITDTASGRIFVKRPGMMRWEYEKPDRQSVITDGNTLWIYRPEDNQVMMGKAPEFFGSGKGAGFLSDMKLIRQQFRIFLAKKAKEGYHILELLPIERTFDVSVIYLSVSIKTFDIVEIVTYNSYGDENKIRLSNLQLKKNLDDSMFSFQTPQGVEILHLDQ